MSKIDVKIVKMHLFDGEGASKATFTWSLNDAITFYGWRVVEGKTGLFVSGPQQKSKDKYFNLVMINSKPILKAVTETAVEAYEAEDKPKPKSKTTSKATSKSKADFEEEDLPF